MPETTVPDPDEDLAGLADLAEEARVDLLDSARWVRANLRRVMSALGVSRTEVPDPDDN